MPCPICEKEAAKGYRPFCSRRCADVDLGKWLNGSYRVASVREEEPSEAELVQNPDNADEESRLH